MFFDPNNSPLYAALQRAALGGTLGGLPMSWDQVRTVLEMEPTKLDAITKELGRMAQLLPIGTLDAAYKGVYARKQGAGLDSLAAGTANGLRDAPVITQRTGVDPARLDDLKLRGQAYRNFLLTGQRLNNDAMDQRLVMGAYIWFLIDRLVTHLEQRFADPTITRQEREDLLDAFGPALVLYDDALRYPVDRKVQFTGQRKDLQAQLQEARAAAAAEETILAVMQDQPVTRQALFDAARRHLAQQQGQPPAPAQGPVTNVLPAQGPGTTPAHAHAHAHGHAHAKPQPGDGTQNPPQTGKPRILR